MDITLFIPSSTVAKPLLWKRSEIASVLVLAQALADTGVSQEKRAAQLEVPRTTLQNGGGATKVPGSFFLFGSAPRNNDSTTKQWLLAPLFLS